MLMVEGSGRCPASEKRCLSLLQSRFPSTSLVHSDFCELPTKFPVFRRLTCSLIFSATRCFQTCFNRDSFCPLWLFSNSLVLSSLLFLFLSALSSLELHHMVLRSSQLLSFSSLCSSTDAVVMETEASTRPAPPTPYGRLASHPSLITPNHSEEVQQGRSQWHRSAGCSNSSPDRTEDL